MLYSTGSNSHGQLGHDTTDDTAHFTPTSYTGARPRQLAFGGTHTLALASDGSLYAAGNNTKGQLGLPAAATPHENLRTRFELLPLELLLETLGDAELRAVEWEVRGIAAAWETSYVYLGSRDRRKYRDDLLLVMGGNDWDEWANGAGDSQRRRIGKITFDHLRRTDDERIHIKSLKAGPRHVLALLELGSASDSSSRSTLVGWGAARHGQLGLHDGPKAPRTISLPSVVTLPPSFEHSAIVDFAIGRDHTVLLLSASSASGSPTLVLLGSSKQGQIGSPSSHPASSPSCNIIDLDSLLSFSTYQCSIRIFTTWSSTFILTDSSLISFGSNSHSQLARPSSDLRHSSEVLSITLSHSNSSVTASCALSAGSEHGLLLSSTSDGAEIYAWGWNEHGNLGTGDLKDGEEPQMVWKAAGAVAGPGRRTPREVWAGCATSWVWLDDEVEGAA